ncbi:MAG: hypothetical protein CVV28_02700 [Methanobacteriales archaeon HGW-Methanobacteriales-1]|nr:MAG: hypothetical protein CVV28_02700 [Methanobacteriales archaeon HGW-Methanobacteriales-1]
MSSIDEVIAVIDDMSEDEKKIMLIIGRIDGSPNKNFTRQTLHKKATDEEQHLVNPTIEIFLSKELIGYYRRPDNFAATKLGFLVAQKLKEEDRERKYGGLRILPR